MTQKLYARAGEWITCEKGHRICQVAEDLKYGHPLRLDTFGYPIDLMGYSQGPMHEECVNHKCDCGASFALPRGVNLHFENGGWRDGPLEDEPAKRGDAMRLYIAEQDVRELKNNGATHFEALRKANPLFARWAKSKNDANPDDFDWRTYYASNFEPEQHCYTVKGYAKPGCHDEAQSTVQPGPGLLTLEDDDTGYQAVIRPTNKITLGRPGRYFLGVGDPSNVVAGHGLELEWNEDKTMVKVVEAAPDDWDSGLAAEWARRTFGGKPKPEPTQAELTKIGAERFYKMVVGDNPFKDWLANELLDQKMTENVPHTIPKHIRECMRSDFGVDATAIQVRPDADFDFEIGWLNSETIVDWEAPEPQAADESVYGWTKMDSNDVINWTPEPESNEMYFIPEDPIFYPNGSIDDVDDEDEEDGEMDLNQPALEEMLTKVMAQLPQIDDGDETQAVADKVYENLCHENETLRRELAAAKARIRELEPEPEETDYGEVFARIAR